MKSFITALLVLFCLNSYSMWEGEFEKIVGDNFETKTEEVIYNLKSADGLSNRRLQPTNPKAFEGIPNGQKVQVKGAQLRSFNGPEQVLVDQVVPLDSQMKLSSSNSVSYPVRSVYSVIVHFENAFSFADSFSVFNYMSQMNRNFRNSSYEQVRYNIKFTNLAEIKIPVYAGQSCDPLLWRTLVIQELQRRNVPFQNYNHLVMYLPQQSRLGCPWTGLGTVGGLESTSVQYSWILNEPRNDGFITTHELGHNNGLGHAGIDSNNDGINESDYGDASCFMGNQANTNMNLPHRVQLGLYENYPNAIIPSAEGNSYFNISALDIHPDNAPYPHGIEIYKGKDAEGIELYYYLSYRRKYGYNIEDRRLSDSYTSGVSIYVARRNGPQAAMSYIKTLKPGETFSDANGVVVRQVSKKSDSVRVFVRHPKLCSPQVPRLTLSKGALRMEVNNEKRLTLNVLNNDSQCPATRFNLANVSNKGYTEISFDQDEVVLESGESVNVGVTVKALNKPTDEKGVQVNLMAYDNDGIYPDHNSVQVPFKVYIDESTCVAKAPSINFSPNPMVVNPGSTEDIKVTFKNNDTLSCTGTRFAYFMSFKAKTLKLLSPKGSDYVELKAGQSKTITFKLQELAKPAAGEKLKVYFLDRDNIAPEHSMIISELELK